MSRSIRRLCRPDISAVNKKKSGNHYKADPSNIRRLRVMFTASIAMREANRQSDMAGQSVRYRPVSLSERQCSWNLGRLKQ